MQELSTRESRLAQELSLMQQMRVESEINAPLHRIQTTTVQNKNVNRYQDFVGKHGHDGGWDPVLHALFLKCRRIHGSSPDFISKCSSIVLMEPKEIMEHENWYTEYQRLSDQNKIEIQRWREEKKKAVSIKQCEIHEVLEKELILPKSKPKMLDTERLEQLEALKNYKVCSSLMRGTKSHKES